mmetsp:Transcript_5349/g.13946  ORF Transcript_5349/g.13946 Transcript_5349/m.13946 type:complete len:239 (+) Transcript_5349:1608-2324(+)
MYAGSHFANSAMASAGCCVSDARRSMSYSIPSATVSSAASITCAQSLDHFSAWSAVLARRRKARASVRRGKSPPTQQFATAMSRTASLSSPFMASTSIPSTFWRKNFSRPTSSMTTSRLGWLSFFQTGSIFSRMVTILPGTHQASRLVSKSETSHWRSPGRAPWANFMALSRLPPPWVVWRIQRKCFIDGMSWGRWQAGPMMPFVCHPAFMPARSSRVSLLLSKICVQKSSQLPVCRK